MNIKDFLDKEKEKMIQDIANPVEEVQKNQNGFDEKQYIDASFAKFHQVMRWREEQTLQTWTDNLLQNLIPYVGGMQASLFYTDHKKLIFSSGYAIDFEESIKKEYLPGVGLIGQVALNQEAMILESEEDRKFAPISSYDKILLKCILILPLVYNGRTIGVLEINFAQEPTSTHIQFLKLLSDSIAANLNALIKERELASSFNKIQSSEERLKRLADVTTEGLVFLTMERTIIETNSAFPKIFGYTEEELKDKKLSDLVIYNIDRIPGSNGRGIPVEAKGIRKDGSEVDIELLERDMLLQDAFVHIISVRDITQKKEAEKILKDKEAELEEARRIAELNEIIKKKNNNITASINYARRIQEAFLPEIQEIKNTFPDSFVFYQPKDIVSGDFYWFTQEDDKVVIAAIDCTGHGVPGAIMSMAGSVFLTQIVNSQEITAPGEILTQLHNNINKALKQNETRNRDGMDAAVCSICFKEKTLNFAGAKNSLVYIKDEVLVEIEGDKMPVGGFWSKTEANRVFKSHLINLNDPTAFYMFTDGYVDQFGGTEGRKFMKPQLKEFLLEIYQKPMEEQKELLAVRIREWMGDQNQVDDMLIIGFRIE